MVDGERFAYQRSFYIVIFPPEEPLEDPEEVVVVTARGCPLRVYGAPPRVVSLEKAQRLVLNSQIKRREPLPEDEVSLLTDRILADQRTPTDVRDLLTILGD